MPRVNRRRDDAARPIGGVAVVTSERYAGRLWSVRRVTGAGGRGPYLCPGCQQDVGVGVPHVVVWPADGVGGVSDRRHWHTGCWQRRDARPAGNAYR